MRDRDWSDATAWAGTLATLLLAPPLVAWIFVMVQDTARAASGAGL